MTAEEIALIRKWIEQGAEWKDHWSFLPLVESKPPSVNDSSWPQSDVDRYVLKFLESKGLKPAAQATASN